MRREGSTMWHPGPSPDGGPMAAEAIFGRARLVQSAREDRMVLTAMASLRRFTYKEVSRDLLGAPYLYSKTQVIARALLAEGHLRVVSEKDRKPIVYEWVDA